MLKKKFIAQVLAIMSFAILAFHSAPVRAAEEMPFPGPLTDNPQAAFIDSHNFAVAHGATAEWRKMEGVALDAANKRLYIAVSSVGRSMADTEGDIQLPENKCGAVYMAELDDQWSITSLSPVVVGGPYDESNADYPCNPDAIANPDNIFVDADGNLWIGEDTDYHKNQFLWMWDGTMLKRFASMPASAEVTGLRVEDDGTLFLNAQHPSGMNYYPFNRGVIGVVTGFSAGDDFTPIEIPTGADTRKLVVASGAYQALARAGDAIPASMGEVYGEINSATGELMNRCNNPDGNMFLPISEEGGEGYLYTNFECAPGAASQMYIQRGEDGMWRVIEGEMVDFSAVNGTWNNCNASVTPWNTGLTSEEYPADVDGEWTGGWLPAVADMEAHLGQAANPYDYGYMVELVPGGGEDDGFGTVATKHYVMGRFSHENADVMGDGRTVYSGDDGTDRILYKFVAANENDLSAGTLYAAKITQDGDTLNVEWIELGTSTDADVAAAIREMDSQFAMQ